MSETSSPPPAQRLHIIVDTREKMPYLFLDGESSRGHLLTGDYSARGYETRVCVERKSKQDLYHSLSSGRKRFERELVRMSMMDYAAIVIETSLPDLLIPPARSAMSPQAVIASVISWSVKYRVHVYFAADRPHGHALTARILEWYVKHSSSR